MKESNYIEVYLERVLKDYLATKEVLEETLKEENLQKLRADVADKSYELSEEELFNYNFEKIGFITPLNGDLVQLKMQLYFTWQAYKELVQPPKELKETIEKELKGVQLKTTYSVVAGKLTLVDEDLYNQYKEQQRQIEKYSKQLLDEGAK